MKSYVPLAGLLVLCALAALTPASPAVRPGGPLQPADVAWMLCASGLVLLMTPGLAYFYGGMVRTKNVVSTMLQSFVAMGLVSVLWVVLGFSLAFGDSLGGVIGNPFTFLFFRGVTVSTHEELAPTIPLLLFALFQLKFAIITPALITGSFAERVRFSSYVLFIALWTLLIYTPLAHWTWHPQGFLRQWGVVDFAGGTVVHLSAGVAALAGALLLGPRRTHRAEHRPANVPYVILGTGMLWFGWFGFNAGSALAANESATLAFANTNTASAAAALAWIGTDVMRRRKVSAIGACIGAVVGLVAITPAAGVVPLGASMLIGAVAAVVSNVAVHLKTRTSIDDTLDVFPCHGVGGMVGMLATAVFAAEVGLVHGSVRTLLVHLGAMVLVTVFVFVGSWLLFKLTHALVPLRVTALQEQEGLDLSMHGEAAGEWVRADEAPEQTAARAHVPA
jgi:Amt family ammonium transporter